MAIEALNLSVLRQDISPDIHWHLFDSLPSTNQYLLELDKSGSSGVHICLAEQQTSGRGRLGRSWTSPHTGNMYLSILWPSIHPAKRAGLSLAIGVAMAEALKTYGVSIQLKWPNDLIAQDKKLGGILIEATPRACVVGIGLNISLPIEAQSTITQACVDIQSLLNKPPQRNTLIHRCIVHILKALHDFKLQGIEAFLTRFSTYDYLTHHVVELIQADKEFIGQYCGLSPEGELLIQLANGQLQHFNQGEVSVRKHQPKGSV